MTSPTSRVPAAVCSGSAALGSARRTRRVVQALASVASASLLLAGCSSSSPNSINVTPPGASLSPSPSVAPTSSSDESTILAQYRSFWRELSSASTAAASARPTMLASYATDPALKSLIDGMRTADTRGEIFYGTNQPRPRIAQISIARGVALVDDCQDSSHAGIARKSTGKRITVGVARNHVVVTMHRAADTKWRVAFITYPKTSC